MENCAIEYNSSTGRAPDDIDKEKEQRIRSTKKKWLTGIQKAAMFIHNPNELAQDWILRNFGSERTFAQWGAAFKQLEERIKEVIDAIPWDTCREMNETIFKNKIKPYAIRFFDAEILRAAAVGQKPHALGPPPLPSMMHESPALTFWLRAVWMNTVRWPEVHGPPSQHTTVLSPAAFAVRLRNWTPQRGGQRRKTAKRKKYYQKKKRARRKRTQRKRTQRKRAQRKRKSRRRKIRARR